MEKMEIEVDIMVIGPNLYGFGPNVCLVGLLSPLNIKSIFVNLLLLKLGLRSIMLSIYIYIYINGIGSSLFGNLSICSFHGSNFISQI
jgi:hypothetical protein